MRNAFRICLPLAALVLAPLPASAQLCTGLCLQQVTCPTPGVTTTISGKVFAPNGVDPLPGVLVYVPNAGVPPLPAFANGPSCRQGGTPPTAPLVGTITASNGSFTLANMPVGTNIPLVVQAGKWRRQTVIPNVAQCTNTAVATSTTRLPKTKSEGDIPRFAIVTGNLDAPECVFRKIGISDTEFTASSGNGRIHLYSGAHDTGATAPGSASETQLEASLAAISGYDMVWFACQSSPSTQSVAAKQNVMGFADMGGRVMTTHYAYNWLYDYAPFSATATWTPDTQPNPLDQTGFINQTTQDGLLLAQWLQLLGATVTQGQLPLQAIKHDFNAAIPPSQTWFTVNDANYGTIPVQYSFDTPVGMAAADQCGRVEFTDYHVEVVTGAGTKTFPAECPASAMNAQEKLYEFLVLNLINNPVPDLLTSIDDAREFARYGQIVTYTVHLTNFTNFATNSIAVTSVLSPGLDAANAVCTSTGGATCTSGAPGGLPANATIPANSTATWVISIPVLASTNDPTVEFRVNAAGADLVGDVDTLVIFRDTFDVQNADGTQ